MSVGRICDWCDKPVPDWSRNKVRHDGYEADLPVGWMKVYVQASAGPKPSEVPHRHREGDACSGSCAGKLARRQIRELEAEVAGE
jgi:hypothetical protein